MHIRTKDHHPQLSYATDTDKSALIDFPIWANYPLIKEILRQAAHHKLVDLYNMYGADKDYLKYTHPLVIEYLSLQNDTGNSLASLAKMMFLRVLQPDAPHT